MQYRLNVLRFSAKDVQRDTEKNSIPLFFFCFVAMLHKKRTKTRFIFLDGPT